MHLAAENGHVGTVKALIVQSAPVDARDSVRRHAARLASWRSLPCGFTLGVLGCWCLWRWMRRTARRPSMWQRCVGTYPLYDCSSVQAPASTHGTRHVCGRGHYQHRVAALT